MPNIQEIDKNMTYNELKKEVLWYSALDQHKFKIYGTSASDEGDFCRLSSEERNHIKSINESVSWLATHCTGIQLHFKTDSKTINLDCTLRDIHNMAHMPATGQCGFDLYVYEERLGQFVLHNTATYDIKLKNYQVALSCFEDQKMREYIINFPLYMGVETLNIGLDEGSITMPNYFPNEKRVVLYGTSIAQGGCVSRPGMMYSNILSRWLNTEFLNYGFSGSAFLEPELAEIIGKHDNQELLIIDAEANAGCDERMEQNLEKFIDTYKLYQPSVPIILVSRCLFALDIYSERRNQLRLKYKRFIKKVLKKYQQLGYEMYFLDGEKFFWGFHNNFTEYTVDGVHPTDLGNYEMAEAHYKLIKKILNK